MVFGAKEKAKTARYYIKRCICDIDCFVVSNHNGNPEIIDGIPVKDFEEISQLDKKEGLIIISHIYEKTEEICQILKTAGFCNIVPSVNQMLENPNRTILKKLMYREGGGYSPCYLNDLNMSAEILSEEERAFLKEQCCLYSVTSCSNMHTIKNSYIMPIYMENIQAGHAIADRDICKIKDDTGIHISEQNPYYCELTAGYWIAHNDIAHKYLGLCHYSRVFDIKETELLQAIRKDIDVILPIPYISRGEIIALVDSKLFLSAIKNTDSDYLDACNMFFDGYIFFPGNIVLAKREIFIDYYKWMFKVLNEMRALYKSNVYKRLFGWWAEKLTNIYFIKHCRDYKIYLAPIENLIL